MPKEKNMSKTAAVRNALKNGEVLTVRGIARRWDINCPYGIIRDIRKTLDVSDRQLQTMTGIRYKEFFIASE
jgi:hypothetical protein